MKRISRDGQIILDFNQKLKVPDLSKIQMKSDHAVNKKAESAVRNLENSGKNLSDIIQVHIKG